MSWPICLLFFFSAGSLIHDALNKLYTATKKNEIAGQIRELLTGEDAPEKVHIISQYLEIFDLDIEAEYRYENEDWFEGKNLESYSKLGNVVCLQE